MISVVPVLHQEATLVTFGADQANHYDPLPASVDQQGTVMTEWELSAEDLAVILAGGRIRVWLLYTGVTEEPPRPFTPMRVEVIAGD